VSTSHDDLGALAVRRARQARAAEALIRDFGGGATLRQVAERARRQSARLNARCLRMRQAAECGPRPSEQRLNLDELLGAGA